MLEAPAIGYRGFRWSGSGPLRSLGVQAEWPVTREPLHAECKAGAGLGTRFGFADEEGRLEHHAPDEGCHCGFYAYTDPDELASTYSGYDVGAVVIGYGDLVVHPDGWRSEMVELLALIWREPPESQKPEEVEPGTYTYYVRLVGFERNLDITRDGVSLLAEQYGVPLLDDWNHGLALAQEQGAKPVPEIMHAEAEAWYREESRARGGRFVAPSWITGPPVQFALPTVNEARMWFGLGPGIFAEIPGYERAPVKPKPKRHELRFDTPKQRHAAFLSECAKRSRPRGA